jgi:NADPH:quinone reductase-like Zn-dependent oxidoreductase
MHAKIICDFLRTFNHPFIAMKAMQVNHSTQGPLLIAAELPQPEPGEGELLISVRAVGVTQPELNWSPTTRAKDGSPRKGAVPGHEFSGAIAALGEKHQGLRGGSGHLRHERLVC